VVDTRSYTASRWLSASDIDGNVNVTVVRAYEEEVGDEKEKKLILEFAEFEKPMILNRTNIKKMQDLFGFDSDDWEKKVIVLGKIETNYKGELVEALRIKDKVVVNG